MDIPGASSVNSSLTLLGRVTDLVKKGATIELQEAIQSLREMLLAEKEEKLILLEELAAVKRNQINRTELVFSDPVYYKHDKEGKKVGPFCQTCFDRDGKVVRLLHNEGESWNCSVCSNFFQTRSHRSTSQQVYVDKVYRPYSDW